MRGKLGFSAEQSERTQNESQGGKTGWKKIERKRRQQNEYDSNGSRNHCTRMVEFDVERQRSDGEQKEGNVGVHQRIEDVLFEGHAKRNDRLSRKVQGSRFAVETLESLALRLAKKILRT